MPIETLRVVLGDQLSPAIAALADLDVARDVVLLAEVMAECCYVPHHVKKLVLVLSAMRHFAAALTARGVTVRYVRLDDPDNSQTLAGEVARAVTALQPARVVTTEPGEWRVLADMRRWAPAIEIAATADSSARSRRFTTGRLIAAGPVGRGRGWSSSIGRCGGAPGC